MMNYGISFQKAQPCYVVYVKKTDSKKEQENKEEKKDGRPVSE